MPILFFSTRYYLRYAPPGYRRERMSYATMSGTVAETVEGARTVDAHRLGSAPGPADRRQPPRVVLRRDVHAPAADALVPHRRVRLRARGGRHAAWSGWLAIHHVITIGAATTVTLYVVQINDPVDRIISWLDELQVGQTSMARLIGVSVVRDDRPPTGEEPINETITMNDVRYAYRAGPRRARTDCRSRSDRASASPSSVPRAPGKSTLGRLLAGIDAPRTGSVMVGDVALASMPLAMLRGHVALVTQEHHVFIGTLRDNLSLAKPRPATTRSCAALDAVDALEWVDALPDGLDTELGTTGYQLSPAQAQQLALARLVLVRPAHLGARRGDEPARPPGGPPPRALPGRGPAGSYGDRDRAPSPHRPRRRPRLRRDRRPDRRARHPRRAAGLNGEYASLWASGETRRPARRRISGAW